jgi:hypothetical protein
MSVTASDSQAYETVHGIRSDTATRGKDLAGMVVTTTFADGTTEVNTWQQFDPWTNGGFHGIGLSLVMGWDGFELTANKTITTILLEAALGNSLFDIGNYTSTIAPYPVVDTQGTYIGKPVSIHDASDDLTGEIKAHYSGIVNIAGQQAAGDAYANLALDFYGLAGGGLSGFLKFDPDLDTLAVAGDLNPVIGVVPTPPSLPLVLSGLMMLGFAGARRRHKAQQQT